MNHLIMFLDRDSKTELVARGVVTGGQEGVAAFQILAKRCIINATLK